MNAGDPGTGGARCKTRRRLAFAGIAPRLAIVATHQHGRTAVAASDRVARNEDGTFASADHRLDRHVMQPMFRHDQPSLRPGHAVVVGGPHDRRQAAPGGCRRQAVEVVDRSLLVDPQGRGMIVAIGRVPESRRRLPLGFPVRQTTGHDPQFSTRFVVARVPDGQQIPVGTVHDGRTVVVTIEDGTIRRGWSLTYTRGP